MKSSGCVLIFSPITNRFQIKISLVLQIESIEFLLYSMFWSLYKDPFNFEQKDWILH